MMSSRGAGAERGRSELFDLTGKVAFVPGGYGGIGQALCWGFASFGARVAIAGRDVEKAEALTRQLREAGSEALAVGVDVTSVEQIRACVDQVASELGSVDILCNCVGIQREQPVLEVTEAAFDEVYAINLKAAMFLGQAVAAHQVAAGSGGSQIHLLSVRSSLGMRDRGYSAYTSTKGGQAMLVKQHAVELARHGIRVNGIAPTFIYTGMITELFKDEAFRDEVVGRVPLGGIPEPTDVVGAAVYLASTASAFVTGQVIYIDGGITASQ